MAIIKAVPHKYFSTREDFDEFMDTQKEWMYNRIVESISQAYMNDYDEAPILLATIEEDDHNTITMNSEYDDWARSLQLALNWYQDEEMYEECSKVLSLINVIKRDYES